MVVGQLVRLKRESFLRNRHPDLADAIGAVRDATRRDGEMLLHVRFQASRVVALNVLASHFESVEWLEPQACGVREA